MRLFVNPNLCLSCRHPHRVTQVSLGDTWNEAEAEVNAITAPRIQPDRVFVFSGPCNPFVTGIIIFAGLQRGPRVDSQFCHLLYI